MRSLRNPEVADEVIREAVEAERERCAAVARTEWANIKHGVSDQATRTDYICQKVAAAILATKPTPPPDEPMTIPKAIEDLGEIIHDTHGNWRTLETVLAALVEAQARRDAALCLKMGAATAQQGITQRACYDTILESAGLKAESTSLFGYQQRGESQQDAQA